MRSPPDESLIAYAAELRAAGASWASIAAKVERDVETCRRWPTHYPDAWNRHYLGARKLIIHQLGVESTTILQQMLRSDDPKLKQDTAKFMARSSANFMTPGAGKTP